MSTRMTSFLLFCCSSKRVIFLLRQYPIVLTLNTFYLDKLFSLVKAQDVLVQGCFLVFCVKFHFFLFLCLPMKIIIPKCFHMERYITFIFMKWNCIFSNVRYIFCRKCVYNYHMKTANNPAARPTLKYLSTEFMFIQKENKQVHVFN